MSQESDLIKEDLDKILECRINKDLLINLLNTSPTHFEDAVTLSLSKKQPQNWRACWILNHCLKKNDDRILSKVNSFIDSLPDKEDGHQRELLKLLNKCTPGKSSEGKLFNICVDIWINIGKSPSVRITAFKTMVKIAKNYPDLNEELKLLSEDHYNETLSSGIKRSFKKLFE
jgi:hypothetical protein